MRQRMTARDLYPRLTFTLRSRQASQLGSFLLCRYALFGLCSMMAEIWDGEGVVWAPLLGRKDSPGRENPSLGDKDLKSREP